MANLTNNKIIFSVDGSFFLEKSYLITAYILAFIRNKVILKGKFITTAALEYRHSYTAKLFEVLESYEILHETVPNEIRGRINISISTDCQAVLIALYFIYSPISFNTHLYQV